MPTLTLDDVVDQTCQQSQKDYAKASEYLALCLPKIVNQPRLLNKLGLLFYYRVEDVFACQCFQTLLQHYPNHYDARNNLGLALTRLGKARWAVDEYHKAIAINPRDSAACSNLAYALHYFGDTARAEIKQAHQAIADTLFSNTRQYCALNQTQTDRVLKIGYVSADFCNHAVARFVTGILQSHNRNNFDVHIFNNRLGKDDAITQALKSFELSWHDIANMSTADACDLIAQHQIDILIDLSGHSAGGRLDIFANRVAPVQMTYLGYPNSTGLQTMDFRLGDQVADPEANQLQNSEIMLRMPIPMWQYTPWPDMPGVSASPFIENGYVTFGSANNHAKLQPEWMDVWAKALAALPDTRFIVKSRALNSPQMAQEFLDFFKQRGVAQERIDIQHRSPTKLEHWQALSQFDIAFDSFPYNGTTTSCDLLWMGVPIITKQGNSHVSRTTTSILTGLHMQSWIADNDKHFIELCAEKSNDQCELVNSRQTLRALMRNTSLGNRDLFIQEYEQQLQRAWLIKAG